MPVKKNKFVYKFYPELGEFYSDINITQPKPNEPILNIYEIINPPINIDSLIKIFMDKSGINPFKYSSSFTDMSEEVFYQKLYKTSTKDDQDLKL